MTGEKCSVAHDVEKGEGKWRRLEMEMTREDGRKLQFGDVEEEEEREMEWK